MKLWQKDNFPLGDRSIEKFTVGRDKEFDIILAQYDVRGSIAHVKMLSEVGLMTKKESEIAIKALEEILKEIHNLQFTIHNNVEDVHSQVELLLTEKLGDIGKKIHSARSRNGTVVYAAISGAVAKRFRDAQR